MGKETGIAWTDHTWNPWQGCRKVSPGCANCYMYRDKKRFGQDPEKVIRSAESTFNAPLRWKAPARVFVCSWSDFFIADADQWREEAWEIMRKTPHLTYQILTKRPENIAGRLPGAYECFGGGWPLPNVWMGFTAENQEQYDKRSRAMLKGAAYLAPVVFVSIEPMLGPINLHTISNKLWVIVGGETGPGARLMQPEWVDPIIDRCRATGTPFFMKQMTNKAPIPPRLNVRQFPDERR